MTEPKTTGSLEPLNFDATVRAALLRNAPALGRLGSESLAALAEAMVVRKLGYKTVIAQFGEPIAGRPLRIVLVGSCLVQTPGKFDRRRVVGPGMMIGEEGLVAWATALGLAQPLSGGFNDDYAYAAEDCWVLELPGERFAGLFGAGAHADVLDAVRAAAWRTSRAPELLDALRRTPELSRASIDDIYGLIEGGVMRACSGEVTESGGAPFVRVVLDGVVTSLLTHHPKYFSGSVIAQTACLCQPTLEQVSETKWMFGEADQGAVVCDIPASHYERQFYANPELTVAVARSTPELALPHYRTEVSLVLASSRLQRELPLSAMIAALAQATREHLFDTTSIVELIWASPTAVPGPLRIIVPRGAPDEIEIAVHNGLNAILATSRDVDVLMVDPSALVPDAPTQRALVSAVASLRAPARLSYLFSHLSEWARVLDIVGANAARLSLLPTVVLSSEAPAPGLGSSFDDIAKGFFGLDGTTLDRGLAAIPAFARGQLRRIDEEGPSALLELFGFDGDQLRSGTSRIAWPKRAVRLRFSSSGLDVLSSTSPALSDPGDIESVRRWARAITGRRVGIALGGAGALSYVCVPLIRELLDSGVPIDIVSGTSFGSMVGAYYVTLGEPGLDLIMRHWYWAQITVLWGWVSTVPLQLWLNFDLGFVDISQLPLPFIPVATNAHNGREWDLRAGRVGHTCAASGSLPPLAPTYDGDTRLLDGGLSADTPNRVLAEAGAAMVVGANAVPTPWPEPPMPALPIPILGDLLRTLNPITRLTDLVRGYGMLFRQAAQSQERFADVTYAADPMFGNGATFFWRNAIAYQAENSDSLRAAVREARQLWTVILSRPRPPVVTTPSPTPGTVPTTGSGPLRPLAPTGL